MVMEEIKENKSKKKLSMIITAIIVIIVAIVIFALITAKNTANTDYLESMMEQPVVQNETEEIENPIDFEKLKGVNPDIYAWIEIPDTGISYPILQHPTDDAYYITRSYDRSKSYYGAIFSQVKYNKNDFSDSCTVLYGHRMRDGSMFAGLSNYMNREYFDAHDKFYIYMPDKVLQYDVFASIPFDNRNILYAWDCNNDQRQYWSFVQTVKNTRSMDANIKEDYKINYDDRIVILSTCYPGDSSNRYLVIGRLMEGTEN